MPLYPERIKKKKKDVIVFLDLLKWYKSNGEGKLDLIIKPYNFCTTIKDLVLRFGHVLSVMVSFYP